jgi:cytosine/adenosine deaminase-related metal-dependent hydrolase
VKAYHERGGLLTAGSDEGEIGGIALIRELELMQEAGIHPIDVIKVATTNATQALGMAGQCGVRVGCRADLAVVNGNPIDNFKVMYGRGYGLRRRAAQRTVEHGGVTWTIRDGIVFDAPGAAAGSRVAYQSVRRRAERKAAMEGGSLTTVRASCLTN